MAKKIEGYIKLQIPAGNANPAPPVGPALGQHGVNIMDFCKQFNAKTQDQPGMIIPVVITVYADHSFSFNARHRQQQYCSRKQQVWIQLQVNLTRQRLQRSQELRLKKSRK